MLFLGTFKHFWGRSFHFSPFGFLERFDCVVCNFETALTCSKIYHSKIANGMAYILETLTAVHIVGTNTALCADV